MRDYASIAKELKEAEAEIQLLQRALAFWLPGVPAEDTPVANQIAADAYLLFGLEGPNEKSAEELGWIALAPPTVRWQMAGKSEPKATP